MRMEIQILRLVTTCRRIAAQLRHADILWVMMQAFPRYFHYISGRALQNNTNGAYKVGPLPVVNGAISPTSRVVTITPVTHLFSAIFRGYKSIYNWIQGPLCSTCSILVDGDLLVELFSTFLNFLRRAGCCWH